MLVFRVCTQGSISIWNVDSGISRGVGPLRVFGLRRFEGFSGVGIQAYRILELRIQCLGFGVRRVTKLRIQGVGIGV